MSIKSLQGRRHQNVQILLDNKNGNVSTTPLNILCVAAGK